MADFGLEIELLNNLLHIGTKAVEVLLKVLNQDLLVVRGRIVKGAERPFARVVEYIAGSFGESGGVWKLS